MSSAKRIISIITGKQVMITVKEIFSNLENPKIVFWKNLSKQNNLPVIVHVKREIDCLTYHTKFSISVGTEKKEEIFTGPFVFETIEEGWLAKDVKHEIDRFALLLEHMFSHTEIIFGDAVFSAASVEIVNQDIFSDIENISNVRKDLPNHNHIKKDLILKCVEHIKYDLSKTAKLLVDKLHYSQLEACSILLNAFVAKIDWRFSLTLRKNLGFSR